MLGVWKSEAMRDIAILIILIIFYFVLTNYKFYVKY